MSPLITRLIPCHGEIYPFLICPVANLTFTGGATVQIINLITADNLFSAR